MEKQFRPDDSLPCSMIELDEVDSTNSYLRGLDVPCDQRLTLVTADFQTCGRGSGTNRWESEKGKNLLFSLCLMPRRLPVRRMFAISEATALALVTALTSLVEEQAPACSPSFTIKWPNDIYYGDSKVAGMLIENDLQGALVHRSVIGIGLNVNQRRFLSDAPNPRSLADIVGHDLGRRRVLERFMERFAHYTDLLCEGKDSALDAMHEHYKEHLYRMGEEHKFIDEMGDFCARIVDVMPSGHLVLQDSDGNMRHYEFKQIKYVI